MLSKDFHIPVIFHRCKLKMNITTALTFMLPEEHVGNVNTIRTQYDKAAKRWPPHINFMFPFVAPSDFDAVVAALQGASLGGPFPVLFDNVGFFPQKSNVTFHLKLSEDSELCFQKLFDVIKDALPHVVVSRPEFKPHLTLGQCRRSEWPAMERKLREWLEMSGERGLTTSCNRLSLLHRSPSTDDCMVVIHTVTL